MPCRILLVLNCTIALLGYVGFFQANYQLASPIIPSSTVFFLVKQQMFNSLVTGILFLIALAFYFFQKRIVTIIITSVSILAYFYLLNLIQI